MRLARPEPDLRKFRTGLAITLRQCVDDNDVRHKIVTTINARQTRSHSGRRNARSLLICKGDTGYILAWLSIFSVALVIETIAAMHCMTIETGAKP